MNKPVLWIALLVGLLTIAGGWYVFKSGQLSITISEAQILERLEEKLPLSKTWLFVFKVTFDKPRVTLHSADQRIYAGLDLALEITFLDDPTPLGGSVDASTGVRYSTQDAAFYLQDPQITELQLDNLDPDLVERTRGVLQQAMAAWFRSQPIYHLSERQTEQAAKAVLRKVTVGERELRLHLGPEDLGPEDLGS